MGGHVKCPVAPMVKLGRREGGESDKESGRKKEKERQKRRRESEGRQEEKR